MLPFPLMFYQEQLGSTSFFRFRELESIPGFIHLFTCRTADPAITDTAKSDEVAPPEQILLESLGVERKQLIFMRQVHSARVVSHQPNLSAGSRVTEVESADGVIALSQGQFPVIRTADCLPILIVLPEQRRLCALHAGWRGTRDRITAKGLGQFLKLTGGEPEKLVVALGPAIRKCCYEVGPEVRDQYEEKGHDSEHLFSGTHFDLIQANVNQLRELGVSQIVDSGMCTSCRTDLFYSYRKEGETGRMWTAAGFFLD